jgi:wobble nucleotide-excising tRNase
LRSCQLGDAGRINARKTIDAVNPVEVDLLLQNNTRVEFTAGTWKNPQADIVVFDSEFVEQNIYSGFEVRPDHRQSLLEFVLGSQTVQLKRQIDQITQSIETQTQRRTQAERILTSFASPYTLAQFIGLQPVLDAQQQIEVIQKRVDAAKNAQALTARQVPSEISLIQFDTEPIFTILMTQIEDMEEAAEMMVKTHLSRHDSREFEDWVSRGQQYLGGPTCPFCGQAIDGIALIESYRSYFNKAYTNLKYQLTELQTQIPAGLSESRAAAAVSAAAINAARIDAWKDQFYLTVPPLDGAAISSALMQVREKLLVLVSTKQRAPLEVIGDQAAIQEECATAIAGINLAIAAYNEAIRIVAAQIVEYKSNLTVENSATLESEIRNLESAQRRHRPDITATVAEYQAAEVERTRLDNDKKSARVQLDALMQTTLQQYQGSINDLLLAFGAEYSIENFHPTYQGGGQPRSDYGLRVRNQPVRLGSRTDLATGHSFATTLSEADKRTLAFAFFVAHLKAEPNLAGRIVVLDDPVSSLDRNRRHQSIRIIADLASKCGQLLVFSHDAYFVRELVERIENSSSTSIKPTTLTLKRIQQYYSAFAPLNIDDVCSSDYHRHHRLVADYVDGIATVNERDVAKAIRPLLEGYYHRRFPGKIPRRSMFGRIIALAKEAPVNDPLAFLQPILKELGEVNDYANQFHHDTNPSVDTVSIVDSELFVFAKRALRLIYENG